MPETVAHFQIRMPPVLHEQLATLGQGRQGIAQCANRRNP